MATKHERKVGPKHRFKILEARFAGHTGWMWDEVVKEMNESPTHYRRIDPVFGRDGWFFDRATGKIWNEQNGIAWENSGDRQMFSYVLARLNARRLSPRERVAIRTLIRTGLCPKALREHLLLDEHIDELHSIRRGAGHYAAQNAYRIAEEEVVRAAR